MPITVIVPVYNAQAFLPRFFHCLEAQTWKDWRAIFVDDGSSDASADLLEDFRQRHPEATHIVRQPNQGAGAARNTGLGHVTTPYVSFLDADDWFEPTFLDKLYRRAEATQADIVLCNYYLHKQGKTTRVRDMARSIVSVETGVVFANPAPWNKLFRKAFLDRIEFRFPPFLYEDLAAITRALALSTKTVALGEYLYHYIKHGSSATALWNEKSLDLVEACRYLHGFMVERRIAEPELVFVLFRTLRLYRKWWAPLADPVLSQRGVAMIDALQAEIAPRLDRNPYVLAEVAEKKRRESRARWTRPFRWLRSRWRLLVLKRGQP